MDRPIPNFREITLVLSPLPGQGAPVLPDKIAYYYTNTQRGDMTAHAILVQLVIVVLSAAIVIDFLHLITGNEKFRPLATGLLLGGTAAAVLAVLTGLRARGIVEIPPEAKIWVDQHRDSGLLTMGSFLLLSAVRLLFLKFHWLKKPVRWGYYGLIIIAAVWLFRTATLGANMVNEHGVGKKASEKAPLKKPLFEEE